MNLAIDIGNTTTKWATFDGRQMVDCGEGMPQGAAMQAERVLACASGRADAAIGVPMLDSTTPLPIALDYKTPATLGPDRIAAACGAHALHPSTACLVIDAGTCITVDFIDASGTYHGGAIMPGLQMNLQALHTFTARLPLLQLEPGRTAPVLGRSTEESILAGTLGATLLALAGFVALYREKTDALEVVLTGGSAPLLVGAGASGWHHEPHLTLIGLNEIMNRHEK